MQATQQTQISNQIAAISEQIRQLGECLVNAETREEYNEIAAHIAELGIDESRLWAEYNAHV